MQELHIGLLRRKKVALLKKAKEVKKKFSFYIPHELWNEYQKVKKIASDKGYKFDPSPELTEALKEVLRKAVEELNKV